MMGMFQKLMGAAADGAPAAHAAPPPAMGSGPPPTRWEKAVTALNGIVQQVVKADPDGIDVMCFPGTSGHVDVYRNVTSTEAIGPILQGQPQGPCYMGYAVDQAFREAFERGFDKPTSILVLTAGRPDDHEQLITNISNAAKAVQKDADLTVTFVQVGDDQWAEGYLKHLDDNLTCTSAAGEPIDIVDTVKDEDIKKAVGEVQQPGFMSQGGTGALIGAFAGAALGVGGMYMYNNMQAKKRTEGWNGTWKVVIAGEEMAEITVTDDMDGNLTIEGYPEDGTAGPLSVMGSYAEGPDGYSLQREVEDEDDEEDAGERTKCPACRGKGGFNKWGKPVGPRAKHRAEDCTLCDGSRWVEGSFERCRPCRGQGAVDKWGQPCRKFAKHKADDCGECDGVGFVDGEAEEVLPEPVTGTIEDEHNIVWSDGSRWEEVPPEGGSWLAYGAAGAGGAAAGGAVGYLVQKKFFSKASSGEPSDYVIIIDRSQNMAVPDGGN